MAEVIDLDALERDAEYLNETYSRCLTLPDFNALIAELRASRKVVEAARWHAKCWLDLGIEYPPLTELSGDCPGCELIGALAELEALSSAERSETK